MSASKTSNSTDSVTKVYWNVPIPYFSEYFFSQHETGKSIESKKFLISSGNEISTEWFMTLFPNGEIEKEKSNVSLFLHCKNANETGFEFKTKFKFGVHKDNGEDCFIFTKTTEAIRSKEQLKENSGYGLNKFLSHEELFKEENGFVVGGKLVVFVELTVEAEIAKPPPKIARSFCSDFKKMFDMEALSDFELKTSDSKVLKAHKVVLAARSPMFYATLTTDMDEAKQGSVDVPHFDSRIMKEVLRYIYCNEVERLEEIAPELIYAAEKYQLEDLKEICLQEITSSLQVGNVVMFLTIAYQVSDAEDLLEKCLDLIVNNFCDVSEKPWKGLPNALMSQIIGRLCKRCQEHRNILLI